MISTPTKVTKKIQADSFHFTGDRKLDVAYYKEGDDPSIVGPFYTSLSLDLFWAFVKRTYARYKNIEHYLYESQEMQVVSDLTACMNEIMTDPLKPYKEALEQPAIECPSLCSNFNL